MNTLRKYPFYLPLLPLFFVLHGVMENYGFIEWKDALVLVLSYFAFTLILFLILSIFIRSNAAILTGLILCLYFFFGAVHEFLQQHAALTFFSRYSISLTIGITLLLVIYSIIKKSGNSKEKFTLYLNILLVIFIVTDTVQIIVKAASVDANSFSVLSTENGMAFNPCDTCNRPDIYFLLFDEYAGSLSLKQRFDFNNDLDSFLVKEKFSVQKQSRSNYHFTPFSVASILNMGYLQGIHNIHSVTAKDYARCNALIRDCQVIRFLEMQGYETVNYSIFDLKGNPSLIHQSFLPVKTRLISERTLSALLYRDMGWMLDRYFPSISPDPLKTYLDDNNRFLSLVKQTAAQRHAKPVFVYAHLNMPHQPYFFDSLGRRKDRHLVYRETFTDPPSAYLGYLSYTNNQIRELVAAIKKNDPQAVIMLMGDHGYRKPDPLISNKNYFFQNMNAVYMPGQNKINWYDSITGVNQFRVILNGLFNQHLPLLKDTVIILVDKK